MDLQQVSVRLLRADAARAEALLNLAEPLALTFDDAADSPIFEPAHGDTPLWPDLIIYALFPADFDVGALREILRTALPGISALDVRTVSESDWQGGLEQAVFVQRIAANLCVIPADWSEAPPADNAVRLNMGLAFGTGRHPTTRLCLQWLAAHPPDALRVCDFGCGSGVLAIAAVRLGAAQAIAIDNDPQAITATQANAQLNGLAERVRAGTAEDFADISADIVLANILAGTLAESVDSITAMLRPGGTIVLSGILEDQVQQVEQAFSGNFESFDAEFDDGWARISAIIRSC